MSNLPSELCAPLLSAAADYFGEPVEIKETSKSSGGCISDNALVTFTGDRQLFVKFGPLEFMDLYRAECDGLTELSEFQQIRTPKPLLVQQCATQCMLIMEAIPLGSRPAGYFENFGSRLAELHRASSEKRTSFGWHRDNFIGSSNQPNIWTDDWTEFVAVHRLGHQIRLAHDLGLSANQLTELTEKVIRQLPQLLGGAYESPVLLHGDLWSGNYLCDHNGDSVLIDPAVYYGHREAEFGMLLLFGGCPNSFYEAYHQAWPLLDGWRYRTKVYRLYHLLNHLNIFGSSYLSGCIQCVQQILAQS